MADWIISHVRQKRKAWIPLASQTKLFLLHQHYFGDDFQHLNTDTFVWQRHDFLFRVGLAKPICKHGYSILWHKMLLSLYNHPAPKIHRWEIQSGVDWENPSLWLPFSSDSSAQTISMKQTQALQLWRGNIRPSTKAWPKSFVYTKETLARFPEAARAIQAYKKKAKCWNNLR